MSDTNQDKNIIVPDIGTDAPVKVIEVNVKVGDKIEIEDPLITLESEKASMEIPAPYSGIVRSISVKVGDLVTEGSHILAMSLSKFNNEDKQPDLLESRSANQQEFVSAKTATPEPELLETTEATKNQEQTIIVPDIGTDAAVKIIEINIKVGESFAAEDSLITLESEKASMEIPAPFAGIVKKILVKIGDSVSKDSAILIAETTSIRSNAVSAPTVSNLTTDLGTKSSSTKTTTVATQALQALELSNTNAKNVYASPSIRRFANELGVDLKRVMGSGRKHRILKLDIENYVKTELAKTQTQTQTHSVNGQVKFDLPEIDFSKFGEISITPLTRIQKLSANNLHRNWAMLPHVTQFDEADITDLEEFRSKYKKQAESKGYKLTPLVFLMKAAAQALKQLPKFNVSLSRDGDNFIQKHYYNIGVAVDTPNGLVVPVIKNVEQKGLFQLAQELAEISKRAREGKLAPKEMQGGCFTISSLGGIGGTAFTPIINYPEVAILGVSKSQYKPMYINNQFVPRLMLPLSLSYDHRAIDGADGARFITLFSQLLGDISQLLL